MLRVDLRNPAGGRSSPRRIHFQKSCDRGSQMTRSRHDILRDSTPPWAPSEYGSAGPESEDIRIAKQFTLYIRTAAGSNSGARLLCSMTSGGQPICTLKPAKLHGAHSIVCELWTDFNDNPLRIAFPAGRIGTGGPHDFIVRYTGPNLHLFIDGVLADEEWPAGSLRGDGLVHVRFADDAAPEPPIETAIWNRPLGDDEIVTLSGGAAVVEDRERAILGEERAQLQYWRPRGYRTGVGDCMPFHHDGRYHLFYLFDRHSHTAKWDKGAHQWAHCSTTDLAHWDHHPLAIAITAEEEGSICTGSVFYWDGIYYAYYAVRTMDGSAAPIMWAVSGDGIDFRKTPHQVFLTDKYALADVRDPMAFRDDITGLFHMLVTTAQRDTGSGSWVGCLAHLTSEDLIEWRQQDTFLQGGSGSEADWTAQPECADYFRWGEWYYLLFGIDGYTHYRISRAPYGPWIRPKVHTLDGELLRVIKTAEFTGSRRIAAGFMVEGRYGGDLVLREVVQNPDGSLGTTFVPELVPACGEPIALTPRQLSGDVLCSAGRCLIRAASGSASATTEGLPENYRLRMEVIPQPGAQAFGVVVGDASPGGDGHELRFEPSNELAQWRHPGGVPALEGTAFTLQNIGRLDEPFTLDVIVKGDLLDVLIGGRRTFVVRLPRSAKANRLSWFAEKGQVEFSAIAVRPIS